MGMNANFFQVASRVPFFYNGMQEATMYKGIDFYGNSLNSRLFLVEVFAEIKTNHKQPFLTKLNNISLLFLPFLKEQKCLCCDD